MVALQLAAPSILGGAVAALHLPVLPRPWLLGGFWAAVGLCAVLLRLGALKRRDCSDWQLLWLLLLALAGASVAILPAGRWQEQQLPEACEREVVELEGEIISLVRVLGAGERRVYGFDLRVGRLRPERCAGPGLARLYLSAPGLETEGRAAANLHTRAGFGLEPETASSGQIQAPGFRPRPGDHFSFEARLRRPWGTVNPHALTGEKQYLIAGIHALGSVSPDTLQALDAKPSLMSRVQRLRDRLSRYIRKVVAGDSGVLLAALAVGDRRLMRPDIWDRLRVFGITHLLVISGMHVALISLPGWCIGSFIARTLRLVGQRGSVGWLPAVSALLPALCYSLLAGLALPTQRAMLMLCLGLLPGMFARTVDSGRLLALAAIGLLLLDPVSVLGASYWLTLGAVAMLLWFAVWRQAQRGLRGAASAQAFMLIAMLPMGLLWFHSASTFGGVVNLLAIPLVTLLVVPLLLLALLLAPWVPVVADSILRADGQILSLLWGAMGYWQAPLESIGSLERVPEVALVLAALLGVCLLPLPQFSYRLLILPLLLLPLLLPQRASRSEELSVLFADVGQGTSVLARFAGDSLLYDTGGGAPGTLPVAVRTVVPVLRGEGIASLDYLVISHPDRDHDAGEEVIREEAPARLLRRGGPAGGHSAACRLGELQRFGSSGFLRFLSLGLAGDSDNNASCVLMLEAYGQRILLPGDIDSRRERELLSYWGADLHADVLMLGHHGSGGSSSRLWLRSVAPHWSVVSAGRANRFGHPATRAVERVGSQGSRLLSTAINGAIELRIRPDGSQQWQCYRHTVAPFWRRGSANQRCGAF